MPSRHTRQQRVVDHIVERLAALGVGHIFGVDGYNRIGAGLGSGLGSGLGLVAATSGGAALNLVTGLGESLTSRSASRTTHQDSC
jgi:acetolactate synthase I/II/III large subunit